MVQTRARRTLKDAPVMWRRINSIGIILDCNSTYAAHLKYAKSEILGRTIFEHVPKESWESMNRSLQAWFETGKVIDRRITFQRSDGTTFPGLLEATSLYDEGGDLLGSNTIIFDLQAMSDDEITKYEIFFNKSSKELEHVRDVEYADLDEESRSEYNGLQKMFDVLCGVDLRKIRDSALSK